MSHQLIQAYFNEIDRLKKFAGTTTEGVISEAFKDLLKSWSRQKNLQFVAQYQFLSSQKTQIRPDGTILHDLRVPLGYWEAKDEHDNLDEEIAKKLRRGYPQDNIIFEDSREAVLIQNRQPVLRCSVTDGNELFRLLTLFFGYERQEIADFRKAVQQFQHDMPAVLEALRSKISDAYRTNKSFAARAAKFVGHARNTINPSVSDADIREMLIQHILTEEIFAHVFNDSDFHRQNNIAAQLYALEDEFFKGPVKRDTLRSLEPYYATIRSTAALITSHTEKEQFLKVIYENFYKIYDRKKADRLGVVYTPSDMVRFIVEGADFLTRKHFGKALIDRGVEILDPAAGTGTFICELLEHFRGQPAKLAWKYAHEIHANEVAILPYYVANLNIEATYAQITKQYVEFPSLCFVDTLDNVSGLGIRRGHQHDLLAALSDENVERVKRQNRAKISVVLGNPPYDANQQSENDNNKNREYPHIDRLIKDTYIKQSAAQKTKLYDMYTRFFRWATDRLGDDGVIAFISNNSFAKKANYDGFRKITAEQFCEVYVIDFKGDARTSGEPRRREGDNIFENAIKVGVAISFLVRKSSAPKGCTIHYAAVRDYAKIEEKRAFISGRTLGDIAFDRIEPDKKHNWVGLAENDWDAFPPIASKTTKAARKDANRKLTKESIFHYVYAVLYDPVYRETYALNLRPEFPRIPLYGDFWCWSDWGKELMALHVGYDSIEPWPLQRVDLPPPKGADRLPPKVLLRADKVKAAVDVDSETLLRDVPHAAWDYKLGNRSALEWVLDQHKERKPKDPIVGTSFNTYRFARFKEDVISLIARVVRVSVETVRITEEMKSARR
jgi:predicted helicase